MNDPSRRRSTVSLVGVLALLVALAGWGAPAYGQESITINGQDGTGSAAQNTLGNDAGWRMIGLPVTNATGSDLTSPSDGNGSVIEFDLQTGDDMFYEYSSGSFSAITSASTGITNGKGYILFLFDDDGTEDADPLDPNITLNAAGTAPSNTKDQTVSGLDTGSSFFLIANPYGRGFKLNQLKNEAGKRFGSSQDEQFKATVQIWTSGATSAEGNAAAGAYCTFTITSNNKTFVNGPYGGSNADCNAGGAVTSWQGFFIEREANAPTPKDDQIKFEANGTIKDNGPDLVGEAGSEKQPVLVHNDTESSSARSSVEAPDHARLGLSLTVEDDDGNVVARDGAASVFFHPDARRGEDGYDATKLTPLAYPFATLGAVGPAAEGGKTLKAQESRPLDVELPLTIPLQLKTGGDISGTARIRTSVWDRVPSSWNVALIDTKGTPGLGDDEKYELAPSDTNGYAFSIGEPSSTGEPSARATGRPSTAASSKRPRPHVPEQLALEKHGSTPEDGARGGRSEPAGGDSTRFALRIEASPLPVELTRIDATTSAHRARVTWATASETNNSGFHVQHRGPESDRFATLGFVESKANGGMSTSSRRYSFETDRLAAGEHAFRLRQVDADGSTTLSDTIQTRVALSSPGRVRVAPNPVRRQAAVKIVTRQSERVTARLYDATGRRVQTLVRDRLSALEPRRVQFGTDALSAGTYFLRVTGETFTTTRKVTVIP